MSRRGRVHRWVIRIGVIFAALLIGAATNILNVWRLAATGPEFLPERGPDWSVHSGDGWYVIHSTAPGSDRFDGLSVPAWVVAGRGDALPIPLPPWSRLRNPPADPSKTTRLIEDARGWPFRSLTCAFEVDGRTIRTPGDPRGAPPRLVDGRELSAVNPPGPFIGPRPASLPRVMPMKPWWPGMIGNTLFFGVLAWVAMLTAMLGWRGLRAARAWLRRRRGRCPHCAYVLIEGLIHGCPECGWKRASADSPE